MSQDAFQLHCDNFLVCVVRDTEWKNTIAEKPILEIATMSDEAFALLTLENNWEKWHC